MLEACIVVLETLSVVSITENTGLWHTLRHTCTDKQKRKRNTQISSFQKPTGNFKGRRSDCVIIFGSSVTIRQFPLWVVLKCWTKGARAEENVCDVHPLTLTSHGRATCVSYWLCMRKCWRIDKAHSREHWLDLWLLMFVVERFTSPIGSYVPQKWRQSHEGSKDFFRQTSLPANICSFSQVKWDGGGGGGGGGVGGSVSPFP